MKTSFAIIASVFVNCAFQQTVHAQITRPMASPESKQSAYIDPSINKGFEGGRYNMFIDGNFEEFTEHWNKTGYRSLGEMVDAVIPDCGKVNAETPIADVTGLTNLWYGTKRADAFSIGYQGPCSANIDGVEVFRNDNCPMSFQSIPAKIPLNYASCTGKCMLVFYFVTLARAPWQSYKFCIPISNGGTVADNTPPNSPPAADTNGALAFHSDPSSGEQGTVKP